MEFAKGLQVEPGSVLIFPDDIFASKVEQGLKMTLSKMKKHQAWQEFQSYVTFSDDKLFRQRSGKYQSQGGLNINIDFEVKRVTDIDNKLRLNITQVIETKGVKIITITGLFMTKEIKENLQQDEAGNVDENHYLMYNFFIHIGGDIFRKHEGDSDDGLWIIQMDGNYWDHMGPLSDVKTHGRIVQDYYDSRKVVPDSYVRRFEKLKEMYFNYTEAAMQYIMEKLTSLYGTITPLSEDTDGRVYTISQNGKRRILRIFDHGEYNRWTPDEFLELNLKLAKLGIGPRIYDSGTILPKNGGQKIVYIVMKAIPQTLRDIEDPIEQEEAVQQAIDLCYRIESLGYYGIDNHAGNFLYDPSEKRVYAIDFADLDPVATDDNKFSGWIRNH